MVKCLSSKATRRARGGRRKRQIREDFVAPEIPFGVMIEILRRLPAKSLMRFRCVSKVWSCLIRSRYFSNLYLMVASSPWRPRPLRLYMSITPVKHKCDSMELCHNPGNSELISLRLSLSESSLRRGLTFLGIGGHEMVSLRGLILYTVCKKACVYNPATRQRLTLPAVKSNIFSQQEPHKRVKYFFGHDPVHDLYKILCSVVVFPEGPDTITSEFWVFVLEAGAFWKSIKYEDQPHIPTTDGLCINGVIYYLAFTNTCRDNVYCFDVRSEKFHKIQAPHAVSQFCKSLGFIEHGGKPALFDYTHIRDTGVSELWVLEVDGGTWSRKSLVLQSCQRYLVDGINITDFRVHGTAQNNEVILVSPCTFYILYYDLIKNDLRKVNIIVRSTKPEQKSHVYFRVLDKCESIMHLET